MTTRDIDPSRVQWRTSTRSTSGNACVETAVADDRCLVRDSKDPSGAVLAFTPREWDAFTRRIKNCELDGS
jgi:Domain of unknown function (DUF397)